MVKIGFIGMGNMGNAILNGLLKTHRPEDMIFSAAHQDKMEAVTARTKVPPCRFQQGMRKGGEVSDTGGKAPVF